MHALFDSAFSYLGEINIFQQQITITLERSFYYLPNNLTLQFLKGNLQDSNTLYTQGQGSSLPTRLLLPDQLSKQVSIEEGGRSQA